MIECILAWLAFFAGICSGEPMWFVASAVYAVAMHICDLCEKFTSKGAPNE